MAAKVKARGPMGRPPKDPSERQRNRVIVMLTDGEYEQLLECAKGEPLGTVAREVLVRWATKGRRPR